jgi:hypothetical protein
MVRRLILAAFVLASIPLTAASADEKKRSADYTEKKICKVEKETGSRLGGVKRCRTRAEQAELRREMRTQVDRIQIMSATACVPPKVC